MSKKMLSMQNGRIAHQKPKKKSGKETARLRRKIFRITFKGVELLWMLVQIVQHIIQIFR